MGIYTHSPAERPEVVLVLLPQQVLLGGGVVVAVGVAVVVVVVVVLRVARRPQLGLLLHLRHAVLVHVRADLVVVPHLTHARRVPQEL